MRSRNGLVILLSIALLVAVGNESRADSGKNAKEIVNTVCAECHRLSGTPTSRFELKAPDLMWAGVKYQRDWLLRWLEGKEENLYPNSYRWDKSQGEFRHMALSSKDAVAVADYFEKNLLDPRVQKGVFNLKNLTEREVAFGESVYKDFSCFGCHQIMEGGKKAGGPISVTLYGAGKRYNLDWLYRFAANPQDFTPHSGEYLADLTSLQVRYLLGYLMVQGVEGYKYYEPWKSEYFKNAVAERGAKTYKTYCAQCHGFKGEGNGPGAAGLDPKPAVHAKMPLSDMPDDYLYNVVYHGGKSVAKSPSMPDWGLTIPSQDFADLIAYLKKTFKGE